MNNISPPSMGTKTQLIDAHRRYTEERIEKLTEGARTSTATAEIVARHYAHEFYPACSEHGALNRIGSDVWRCLVKGCNIGCRYPVEPQHTDKEKA